VQCCFAFLCRGRVSSQGAVLSFVVVVSQRRSSVFHSPPSSTTAAHSSPPLEVTKSLSLASNFVFILHLPISSFDFSLSIFRFCLPAFQSRFRFHFICHCVRFFAFDFALILFLFLIFCFRFHSIRSFLLLRFLFKL